MNRNRLLYLFMGTIIVILIIIWIGRPCPPTASCDCERLGFDQHDGVGTFLSFSRDPMGLTREPEIAPARIRARGGEKITWVIRNPSDNDISVGLHSVVEAGSDRNVMRDLFSSIDPPIKIGKGCRIAPLQGRLNRDILHGDKRDADCDSSRVFHYFFMVKVLADGASSKGDTLCEWPYDPELVVERDP